MHRNWIVETTKTFIDVLEDEAQEFHVCDKLFAHIFDKSVENYSKSS
jgi:hypothetical protein